MDGRIDRWMYGQMVILTDVCMDVHIAEHTALKSEIFILIYLSRAIDSHSRLQAALERGRKNSGLNTIL